MVFQGAIRHLHNHLGQGGLLRWAGTAEVATLTSKYILQGSQRGQHRFRNLRTKGMKICNMWEIFCDGVSEDNDIHQVTLFQGLPPWWTR